MAAIGKLTLAQKVKSLRQRHHFIPSEIDQRWRSRVLPNGWHHDGLSGGFSYLKKYGKNILEDKSANLASKAEQEGCKLMAVPFWIEAHATEVRNSDKPLYQLYHNVVFALLKKQPLTDTGGRSPNDPLIQEIVAEVCDLLTELGFDSIKNDLQRCFIEQIKAMLRTQLATKRPSPAPSI